MNIDPTQITKKFQLQNCYLKDHTGQIINSGEFITFKSFANGLAYCIEYVKFHDKIHVILYNPIESYGFKVHYLNNSDIINSDIVKLDKDEFESKWYLMYLKKPWKLFHLQRGIQIRSTWSEFPVLLCKNLFFNVPIDHRNCYNNYGDYNQWKNNINFSKYTFVAALAKQNSKHIEVIFKQY